jgi:ATP-dependent protease ClpP protease subunit
MDKIILKKANTVSLRGVVADQSMARLQWEILTKSAALPKGAPLYLVLHTPGGSIYAGNALIDTIKGLDREVKTITLFSASMGFHIVQNSGERLITGSGILMSHRASVSFDRKELPGEALTILKSILRVLLKMDMDVASRMELTLETYRDLTRDEYWVDGSDAVKDKAADRVVLVQCGSDLIGGTEITFFDTLLGGVRVLYPECPLIYTPIQLDMSGIKFKDEYEKRDFLKYFNTMLYNPRDFLKEYVIPGKYNLYLQ